MEWTPETVEQLRALWREGHPTAEIGRRLKASKNAVIGKIHRLNLTPRPSPIRRDGSAELPAPTAGADTSCIPKPAAGRKGGATLAAILQPKPPAVTPATPVEGPAASRSSTAAKYVPRPSGRTCCWPIGEPGRAGFHFCDGPASVGKPYCPEHVDVAYLRGRDRRDAAA